jgi:hypothetical protein
MNPYGKRLRALLSAGERNVFARLKSPKKIQDFVDSVPINLEETGETLFSPRRVLRENRAHCMEGALFAAACFAYHDQPALVLDFQASPADDDHVVALFRRDRLWGAISKTNHAPLCARALGDGRGRSVVAAGRTGRLAPCPAGPAQDDSQAAKRVSPRAAGVEAGGMGEERAGRAGRVKVILL